MKQPTLVRFMKDAKTSDVVARIVLRAMVSTPKKWDSLEYRMLNDMPVRLALQMEMPHLFRVVRGEEADILFAGWQRVSMKKQKQVFPRPKRKGTGLTAAPHVKLSNTLGGNERYVFGEDLLWVYQPPADDLTQNYAMGLVDRETVNRLMERRSDGWVIAVKPEDCVWHREFETYSLVPRLMSLREDFDEEFEVMLEASIRTWYGEARRKAKILS